MRHQSSASRFPVSSDRPRRQFRRRAGLKCQVQTLEDRCLMTGGVPIPAAQLHNQVPLSQIFWNGGAPIAAGGVEGLQSPQASNAMKTITITNYSGEFIYPFLRSENTGKAEGKYYDPQDNHKQEFREYVGYSVGSGNKAKDFLGLPPHATVTIQVPLVLWDGNHLTLATDGTDLTASKPPLSVVFGYDPSAQITLAQTDLVGGSVWVQGSKNYPPAFKPLVMFYHANTSLAVGNDAPAQLVELTFRDPYLKNFITDSSQTFPELSYDVSYVNTLHAPAALEASGVPITAGAIASKNLTYFRPNKDWGWNGSQMTIPAFNPLVQDFISNNPQSKAYLGAYFGGKGWPEYYNPNPNIHVIPSGANIFDDSPLDTRTPPQTVHTSHYNSNRWLLSSSGGGAITASAGGLSVSDPLPKTLSLLFTSPQQKKQFAQDVASMKQSGQTIHVSAISASGTYANVGTLLGYKATENGGIARVKITSPLPTNVPFTYTFSRIATDYASTDITNLWYSWAQYYVNSYAQQHPGYSRTAEGSLVSKPIGNSSPYLTNEIKLDAIPHDLAVGMTVSAPSGIPNNTTVLKIDARNSIVYLSQIPSADAPKSQTYTFGLPSASALPTSPFTTTYTLTFDPSKLPTNPPVPDPLAFAGSIYEAMVVEATTPFNDIYLPDTMNVVDNVIKFNADIPFEYKNAWSNNVIAEVRDIVKSILRGVVDYEATPDQNLWYPNPASMVPGTSINGHQAKFNVFNLDPYVWFVHQIEGLSGYGFSVDDDVANPIASGPDDPAGNPQGEPNNLQTGFGGINAPGTQPLGNQKEWFPTTRFGSLLTMAIITTETGNPSYNGSPIITLVPTQSDPNPLRTLNQIVLPGPGQVGANITAPQNPGILKPGTTLTFFPDGVDNASKPNIMLSDKPLRTPPKQAIPVFINASPTINP